jgi:2-C-methyl-D-erythritol 4-phosphate cytidylyltransferase
VLIPLAGRPMIAWCLEAFAAAATVNRAVIAASAGRERELRELAPPGLAVEVVAGGESRSQSVAAALAAAGEVELVAVHDAARPLVTAALIDAIVTRLAESPDAAGVIAAHPVTDTIKRLDETAGERRVAETLDRGSLWAAQTPQAFRAEALRAALAAGAEQLAAASDDASLVEASGGQVLIEPGPRSNLKVTTPTDLTLASLLLSEG